jgi:hypothetical protein
MLSKLLTGFLGALPFFFGLAFLAPLAVQVLASFNITKVGGFDTWPIALAVFGAWGGLAAWRGRWI